MNEPPTRSGISQDVADRVVDPRLGALRDAARRWAERLVYAGVRHGALRAPSRARRPPPVIMESLGGAPARSRTPALASASPDRAPRSIEERPRGLRLASSV